MKESFEEPKITAAESAHSHEAMEQFSSKIALRFFRHNEKESVLAGEPQKADEEIRLTPAGRKNAKDKANLEFIDQAVSFGSPRKRTRETAALHMAGATERVTGEEDLDQLIYQIDQTVEGVSYGTKLMVDPRLNFNIDAKNKYVETAMNAFKDGWFLQFFVEGSDELAKEVGDIESSTYTRTAASVAQIIEKYLTIAPRFDKLVQTSPCDYQKEMHRFFGTHQSIGESFLAKVIEKTDGIEQRDAFVRALDNKGFGFSEGFELDIITPENNGGNAGTGSEPIIHISYKHEGKTPEELFVVDKEIPMSLIQEIAREGN